MLIMPGLMVAVNLVKELARDVAVVNVSVSSGCQYRKKVTAAASL